MLRSTGPNQWYDSETGITTTVKRVAPFRVEVRSEAGVDTLYGADAERAVDALQYQLLREYHDRRHSGPLWPLYSGYEIPYRLAGTVELVNGEPVRLA